MKIEIDLNEIFVEESDIASALKLEIIRDAVNRIKSIVDDNVRSAIDNQIKDLVDKLFQEELSKLVAEKIQTNSFKPYGYSNSNTRVTINEYIAQAFESSNCNNSIREHITTLISRFTNDFNKRYDMFFASQLINKMKANDLLAEGVNKFVEELNANEIKKEKK